MGPKHAGVDAVAGQGFGHNGIHRGHGPQLENPANAEQGDGLTHTADPARQPEIGRVGHAQKIRGQRHVGLHHGLELAWPGLGVIDQFGQAHHRR